MQTDWLIVRRIAAELARATRGRRVRAIGLARDERFIMRLDGAVIAIDAFGPDPVVTLEDLPIVDRTRWWVKAAAGALEGLRIDGIRGRRGDRLIAFDCSARSRFGVATAYRLVVELVPRFGNIVVLKEDTVVTAAREFRRDANAARATVVGAAYEPPPLPTMGAPSESFSIAVAAMSDDRRVRAVRALRGELPLVPRLIAESIAVDALDLACAGADPSVAAARGIERASALIESTHGDAEALGDVFVYRDAGVVVAAHVVPLAQYAELSLERVAALLPVVAEAHARSAIARVSNDDAQRRGALQRRVSRRRDASNAERIRTLAERDDATGRDALRHTGELLYTHLHDVPSRATAFVPPSDPTITIVLDPDLDAKGNAAAIFKRYRKATAKLAHIERRLAELDHDIETLDAIAWEIERAEADTFADVAETLERVERGPKRAKRAADRKRPPLDVPLGPDARLYVGRSPQGNADVTFRIARPDDLWFHARETPGAHVVLRIDSGRPPQDAELERAAEIAAFHSKARGSEKVAVDYTERKHVRRQRNAPPGLVWYVNARTLTVTPNDVAAPGA